MNKKTLYIAYGSNLNIRQMAIRCPTAMVTGVSKIKGYELLFRGGCSDSVATVEPLKDSNVPVLLWTLRDRDIQALDRYEGYPYLYRKEFIDVELKGKIVSAMIYLMNEGHPFGSPSDKYLDIIMEGYRSAGFDTEFLEQAVEKSFKLAARKNEEQDQTSIFDLKRW